MMERDDALIRGVARLCDLEVEYDMTRRVLAVMVERVQQLTGSDEVQVGDDALADLPDLTAWRDEATGAISMHTNR